MNTVDGSKEVTLSPIILPIDDGPHRIVIDEKSSYVFVSCKSSNSIMVVDGLNNRIKQKIEVKSPDELQIDKKSSRVFAKNKDQIHAIDIGTKPNLSVDKSFSVRADGEMVLDPVRNLIYVYHKSYASMDVIDSNSGLLLKVMGTKERSWGMAIDSLTNKMYVSNVTWWDNIVIDLNSGRFVGRLYLPDDYPRERILDPRDYVDWFNRKIIVDEIGQKVLITYPFLRETTSSTLTDIAISGAKVAIERFAGFGIPSSILDAGRMIDWSTRGELLAIYDSTNDALISSNFFDGMTEMCLDSNNSKIYMHVPFNNIIYVLDKNGKILETISIAKPKNKDIILTDSNLKIHIEDLAFPLNKNSRYGFEIDSKLNKVYLTIEGKSQDFLLIFDLNN